ncbi:MAG: E3 binding domain-containing protein, partial [Neisseriaceae bacterium]|nr:E3 binding domain-containing protein [Neisseriaceae bacterium]
MIIEIKVPALPESVSEATLMSWHKKVGEAVSREENLIDLETDKVVLELPSPDAGVITEILANDGDTVVAGQVIAKLDTAASVQAAPAAPAKAEEPAKTQAAAMPAAAKIAAENNVDLSQVKGSGRDGRILKEDVQAKPAAAAPVVASSPAIQIVGERPEQRVPMSRLRERVA